MYLEGLYREIFCINFLGTEVWLSSLWSSRYFFYIFQNKSGICFLSVLTKLSQSTRHFKDNWEWPCSDIGQLPPHFWVYPILSHGLVSIYSLNVLKLTLLWWEVIFTTGLRGLGLLKAKGKEGIHYFGLCCVFCHQVSLQQIGPQLPWHVFCCWCISWNPFCCFSPPHEIQLCTDLSFLTMSLSPQTVPLCIFWVTCPSFYLLPTSLLCLRFSGSSCSSMQGSCHSCLTFSSWSWTLLGKWHISVAISQFSIPISFHFRGSSPRHIEPTLIMTLILLVHCSILN